MPRLRACACIFVVSGIAGVFAASCQGQIGGGTAGSGGPGGDGSGGAPLGRGGNKQGTGGYSGSGGAASGGIGGTGSGGDVSSGKGGASGTAGASGSGGASGASGTAGVSGMGGASDGGVDSTFTAVYASLFGTSLCAGTLCHNPGLQRGIDLSSQANAYESLKFEVVPGDGAGSALYRILLDGTMPPDPPKAMSNQLAAVRAWIDAGALNN